MNKPISTAAAITAALTMMGSPGIAAAGQSATEQHWEVRLYVDRAQLITDEGLEQVHAHMRSQARAVCRDAALRDIQARMQERQCRDDIMMQLARAIDSQPLLALAQSRLAVGAKRIDAS